MEELDYLIDYLINENDKISINSKPTNLREKQDLYHALVNIRQPKDITDEYIHYEDKYLQKLLDDSIVTSCDDISLIDEIYPDNKLENGDKLAIWQGDITKLYVDAIVNAANSRGLGCFVPLHRCIDNQINTYAGIKLRLECNEYMKSINYHLNTSEAFITGAYNLPSNHIIHTVGPIITDSVTAEDKKLLEYCYINSLELAKKYDIKNIAFPCISTGEFKYPKTDACKCVLKCVDKYLDDNRDNFDKIIFNLYTNEDVMIYERYIKENF